MRKIKLSTSSKYGKRPQIEIKILYEIPEKVYCNLFSIYCNLKKHPLDENFTPDFLDWCKKIGKAKTINFKERNLLKSKRNQKEEADIKSIYDLMNKRRLD